MVGKINSPNGRKLGGSGGRLGLTVMGVWGSRDVWRYQGIFALRAKYTFNKIWDIFSVRIIVPDCNFCLPRSGPEKYVTACSDATEVHKIDEASDLTHASTSPCVERARCMPKDVL